MTEFLELWGGLFAVYVVLRLLLWTELWMPTEKSEPGQADDAPGKAIDAAPLCDRLQDVRRDYVVGLPAGTQTFKRQLRVESKRAEVAAQAYFQKPAMPEPDEPEDGMTLFLV